MRALGAVPPGGKTPEGVAIGVAPAANLLVAGRCISTTHEALASTRLTPTVMTLGQAAGTAAALACARAVNVGDVDARALRSQLVADGVLL